ncbi:MAG: LLM class flavin-dependent oxidoreductase [Candidatus Rokubacteria bacterium]|nr:LLM class flavin-dependent oxidoreductase [Candidatus Rokubacteria bacterium]
MRYGLFISSQHAPTENFAAKIRDHVEQVATARDCGFDSVFFAQHFLANPYAFLHPLALLARLAGEGRGMVFGTGVLILPLYHPVELAEHVATLDAICDGKLVLGVGMGYRDEEFAAFGLRKRERVSRFEESLAVMTKLWTEESVTFRGQHFQLDNVTTRTRPVQKPHPPIWIGAKTDAAVERAARLGDAWVMTPSDELQDLDRQMKLYCAARVAAGKSPDTEIGMIVETYVAPHRKTALGEAEPYLRNKYSAYALWKRRSGEHVDDYYNMDRLITERFILGDPEDCVKAITELHARLGVNHFLFRMQWPGMAQAKVLRTIQLIGRAVIPAVKSLAAR